MKRWQVLTVAGLLGVASLWLVPFQVLLPGVEFTTSLRLLSLIQPTLLTLVAVLVGHYLSPRVGLGAPLVDAALTGGSVKAVLLRSLPLAAVAGFVIAAVLIAHAAYVVPEIGRASALGARLSAFEMPLLTKLLYGGITEELLTRWGLMSLFAWIGWRLSGRPEGPRSNTFWLAIVGAALAFALGHLPLLIMIVPNPQPWLIAAVVLGNTIPGVIFGWLFWRRGIEAAMFAHMTAHLISTVVA